MNKFYQISTGKTAYARFIVGNGKSGTYEVGHRGMNRRIDVAGECYTFAPASDFTNDQSLVQHALSEAETVETLNAFFAEQHGEYLAVCAKYGMPVESPDPAVVTTRVQWIGCDGATLELEAAK